MMPPEIAVNLTQARMRRRFRTTFRRASGRTVLAGVLAAGLLFAGHAVSAEEASWGFVPIPIIGYSPDTGVLLGGSGFLYWEPETNAESNDNNTVSLALMYGTRGMYAAPLNVSFNLADGAWKPDFDVYLGRSPEDFFGIGPETGEGDGEVYRQLLFDAEASVLRRLRRGVYLGPVVRGFFLDVDEVEEGGLLDEKGPTGVEGIETLGGGARLVLDTREPQLYPLTGTLLRVQALGYPSGQGTHDGFLSSGVDYRRYFNPGGEHVVALQGVVDLAAGDVPFQSLPSLGGQDELRGYPEGRYRDDVAVRAQAEYRFPIRRRFGGVVFGAAGQVAPAVEELTFLDPAASAGIGLRFTLDTRQNLNLRFDLARSREGVSFYVAFREAF